MDLTTFTKIIFRNKKDYRYITDKEKKDLFFIFNRYMARAAPANADALNTKGIDGALAMEVWNRLCERYLGIPDWFFPRVKAPKSVKSDGLDEIDLYILNTFYADKVQVVIDQEKANSKKKEQIVVKKLKRKKKAS